MIGAHEAVILRFDSALREGRKPVGAPVLETPPILILISPQYKVLPEQGCHHWAPGVKVVQKGDWVPLL